MTVRPRGRALDDGDEDSSLDEMSFLDDDAADHSAAVYFGTGVLGSREGLQSWAPGAAPILCRRPTIPA